MARCEEIREAYLTELAALIGQWKGEAGALERDGATDEAILKKIQINIGEIFETLFHKSYEQTCSGDGQEEASLSLLFHTYLAFFEKVPAPWRERLVKNKEHQLMEDFYKEKLKLETASQIKQLFLKYGKQAGEGSNGKGLC